MNPDLPLDYYLDLLASIKAKFPKMHIHAFSPPEMVEFGMANTFNHAEMAALIAPSLE